MSSSSSPALWLVLPVYKDVEAFLQLRRVLLDEVASGLPVASPRLVVIDDSAGLDPDLARLLALEDVTVLTPPFNLGHQRALVFGLRTLADQIADHDLVITLDSDGEDQPRDIPRLLAPLVAHPELRHTVVLARRTRRRESIAFKVLYFFFKILFRALTGTIIRTGNFAAYRGWVARNIVSHPHFDVCYSSSLLSLDLPVDLVPCERGRRYAGRSHMSYLRLLMHGIRMLMPFLDRIAVRSLLGFSCMFALGVAVTAVVVGIHIFAGVAIPSWASYAIVSMLVISFLALGNFVILFTIFSQSQAFSLASLDRTVDRTAAWRSSGGIAREVPPSQPMTQTP